MSYRKSFALVGSVCAAGLLLGALPSLAVEVEDDFLAMKSVSTEDLTYISQSGTEIVGHIEKARAGMDRSDWTSARWNTAQARSILGRVREKSPPLRIQDRIARVLKDARTVGAKPTPQSLLPIYAELDAVEEQEEVADVRTYVDQARSGLQAGQIEVAEKALVEASARVRYLEIDLPIEDTYGRLTRAMMQITGKDIQGARLSLQEAEKGIQAFQQIASASVIDATSAVGAGPE